MESRVADIVEVTAAETASKVICNNRKKITTQETAAAVGTTLDPAEAATGAFASTRIAPEGRIITEGDTAEVRLAFSVLQRRNPVNTKDLDQTWLTAQNSYLRLAEFPAILPLELAMLYVVFLLNGSQVNQHNIWINVLSYETFTSIEAATSGSSSQKLDVPIAFNQLAFTATLNQISRSVDKY